MFPMLLLTVESPDERDFLCRLYDDYYRLMYATAGKYTAHQLEKEDIVQDALEKMVKHVKYLQQLDRCILPSVVVILVRNTAINHAKHLGVVRKHTAYSTGDSNSFCSADYVLTVEDMVALNEVRDALDRVWPKLSETDRILLEGKYLLGLRGKELAELVGCKPDSVRMMLTRARRNALAEMKRIDFTYDES